MDEIAPKRRPPEFQFKPLLFYDKKEERHGVAAGLYSKNSMLLFVPEVENLSAFIQALADYLFYHGGLERELNLPQEASAMVCPSDDQKEHQRDHADRVEPETKANIFMCSGRVWTIRFEGHGKTLLPHQAGFDYIRELLGQPNQPFTPFDLKSCVPIPLPPDSDDKRTDKTVMDLPVQRGGTGHEPMISEAAIKDIQLKLRDLNEDILAAEADGKEIKAKELNEKRDELIKSVKKVAYKQRSGRVVIRPMSNSPSEKTRKAVGIAIRRAISAIEKNNKNCGQHLHDTIKYSNGSYKYNLPADQHRSWST